MNDNRYARTWMVAVLIERVLHMLITLTWPHSSQPITLNCNTESIDTQMCPYVICLKTISHLPPIL